MNNALLSFSLSRLIPRFSWSSLRHNHKATLYIDIESYIIIIIIIIIIKLWFIIDFTTIDLTEWTAPFLCSSLVFRYFFSYFVTQLIFFFFLEIKSRNERTQHADDGWTKKERKR